MNKFPSAEDILKEALKINPRADMNELHSITYRLMLKHKKNYYSSKVDVFLQRPFFKKLDTKVVSKIKDELLKPVRGGNIKYSNIMEESSRRISQTFQPLSGNISEGCVERDLISLGLIKGKHYERKFMHTDFYFFYPEKSNAKKNAQIGS